MDSVKIACGILFFVAGAIMLAELLALLLPAPIVIALLVIVVFFVGG